MTWLSWLRPWPRKCAVVNDMGNWRSERWNLTHSIRNYSKKTMDMILHVLVSYDGCILSHITTETFIRKRKTCFEMLQSCFATWHFKVLFVCVFNRSVRADTRMGPEGTKLKQKPEPGLEIAFAFASLSLKISQQLLAYCFVHGWPFVFVRSKSKLKAIKFTLDTLSRYSL